MRLSTLALIVTATLVTSLLVVPPTSAHGIRTPCAWEHRLLHDHEDDLGDSTVSAKHGHELHGLDLVESWDETLGDVLVFRLSYEGGYSKSSLAPAKPALLKDVLSFQAGTKTLTFEWRTSDNSAFTGTFDKVVQPVTLTTACNSTQKDEGHLGDRQTVEGWIAFDKHGIAPGTSLSKFKVESFADATKADTMGEGTSKDGDDAWFQIAQHVVAARPKIIDGKLDWEKVDMKVGENKTVVVTFKNLVGQAAEAHITYQGPTSTKGTFHLNDDIGYQSDAIAFQQAKSSEATIHLYLAPSEIVSGERVTVDLFGDIGSYTGHVKRTLTLNVAAAATTTTTTEDATPTTDTTDEPIEDAPREGSAPAALLFIVSLLVLAIVLRRWD